VIRHGEVRGRWTGRRFTTHNPALWAAYGKPMSPEEAMRLRDQFREIHPRIEAEWNDIVTHGHPPEEPVVLASAGPDLKFRPSSNLTLPLVFSVGIQRRWRDTARLIAGSRPILRVVVGKNEKIVVLCRDYDRRIVRRTFHAYAVEEAHQKLQERVLALFEAPLHMQRSSGVLG
jgi:hypothetical protein